MSQKIKTTEIVIKQASLKTATFVNFEINKEGWNLYKIEDGTLLKARVLLLGILMENKLEEIVKQLKPDEKPKLELAFHSKQIFSVESPLELRGTPDSKTYTIAELRGFIVNKDVDFETIREVWNIYELENKITIKFKIAPVVVSKTNKFDRAGMPIYVVDSNIFSKTELPDHLRKLLKPRKISDSKS